MGTKEKLSEMVRFDSNPFLAGDDYQMKVRNRNLSIGVGTKVLVDQETGMLENVKMVVSRKDVDQEKFMKIYISKIEQLFELTKTAQRVLKYVFENLKKDQGEVYIHIQSLMDFCMWEQSNQAYKGLTELCNNDILARSQNPAVFYINPTLFFNGNRIAYVEEYRVTDSKKKFPAMGEVSGMAIPPVSKKWADKKGFNVTKEETNESGDGDYLPVGGNE